MREGDIRLAPFFRAYLFCEALLVPCGLMWRAGLPALGCEAAPEKTPRDVRLIFVAGIGAAALPNAGKPARHIQRVYPPEKPAMHKNPLPLQKNTNSGELFRVQLYLN